MNAHQKIQQKVWYQLVDPKGAILPGSTPYYVMVADDADMLGFLRTVADDLFAKAFLRDVHFGKIRVFKNQQNFEWMLLEQANRSQTVAGNELDQQIIDKWALRPGDAITSSSDKNDNRPGSEEANPLWIMCPKENAPVVNAPVAASVTSIYGLDQPINLIPREKLVKKIIDLLEISQFVVVASPAGSGKTTLCQLLLLFHPRNKYVYIPCKENTKAIATIFEIIENKKRGWSASESPCIVMVDDAQLLYDNRTFWYRFIKSPDYRAPVTLKFIIIATHLLETNAPSSVDLQSLPGVGQSDLMIDEIEARHMIQLTNGLPPRLRFPSVVDLLIRECSGFIGALRLSIDRIKEEFRGQQNVTDDELIAFIQSHSRNKPPCSQ